MRAGQIVEQAACETLFTAPRHPYSRLLLDAEPAGEALARDARAPVLQVRDMKVWYALGGGLLRKPWTHVKAVDGVSLEVQRGKTLGIVGESGSGKSTLGQAILRLIKAEGSICFQGQDLHGLTQKQMRPWRRKMQIVFQDPYGSLSPRMSVAQIIAEGLEVHLEASAAQCEDAVIQALREVGIDPATRHRYPHEFSGGQRQRIAIARALVLKPELIVLDEPTSALDRTVQKQVVALLRDLQERHGLTYLFISHDLAVVRALAHDIIVLKDGQVVERGPSHELFEAPQHPYTQELLAASALGDCPAGPATLSQ
jgi:microcin C transport system ATP-binding protein